MVKKVKKSSLKKDAAPPEEKSEAKAGAKAQPKAKEGKSAKKAGEAKEKPQAAGKEQLGAQAVEEILKAIAKPDSQKISAFVLPDWHLKYKDTLGSYKKFVKNHTQLQIYERADGNYIIQKKGDTSVPPDPEFKKDVKVKDWKQLLQSAWNIYCQATPKQEWNVEVFCSALPRGVRQLKPENAGEKPEEPEKKNQAKKESAKKDVAKGQSKKEPAKETEVKEPKKKKKKVVEGQS
ncbi:unnamed protein product [Effrenium voratum]|nr:unnamed protein product [Effrenium voratum]